MNTRNPVTPRKRGAPRHTNILAIDTVSLAADEMLAAEAWWIALQTGKYLHKGTIWEDCFSVPSAAVAKPKLYPDAGGD